MFGREFSIGIQYWSVSLSPSCFASTQFTANAPRKAVEGQGDWVPMGDNRLLAPGFGLIQLQVFQLSGEISVEDHHGRSLSLCVILPFN